MSKHLVIVESPAKAKTIGKYLGPDFEVLASYGHVRDLLPKEGAVDPAAGFRMNYVVLERSEKQIQAITKALRKAESLILATDPDREGEAISWHLLEILRERGLLGDRSVKRVVFHEITKPAIAEAIAHPRDLSVALIDAQQARRALDYLVGFNLSPLLWRKIKRGLSAGRVQSPALRMICEREDEIEAFQTREYWTLDAQSRSDGKDFTARLQTLNGHRLDTFDLHNEALAQAARQRLLQLCEGRLRVEKVERKERKRNPAAPFTTSTLQQEASRKLGFTASRTMRVAQQLYEGIDLGNGAIGMITYMRTDSVTLAGEAIREIRDWIAQRFGADNLPSSPRQYKTKAKNAQEAHEAIRPTSVHRLPEEVRTRMSSDQARLYELIWKRTVACQMLHATFDTVAADLVPANAAGLHQSSEAGADSSADTVPNWDANTIAKGVGRDVFRATGSTLRHPGFIAVYQEGRDEKADAEEDEERRLPELERGMEVTLLDIRADQHFTEPPPRYTEATLVKTLEEYGIGRPSTYASIISTLQTREYVEMDGKRFLPTDVGRIVNSFLTQHFERYVDYDFTAKLEDELDEIARGEQDWVPVLERFWTGFRDRIEEKSTSVSRAEAVQSKELGLDPKSGRPVSVRMGRFGPIAQIGTKDDAEKPRFAGLLPGQKMDQVTLEEALDLFRLPRELGMTEDGEPVQVNVGRFGPYVKYGSRYASLGADDDVWTVELPRALEIIAAKKAQDAARYIRSFPDAGIEVLNGRYGPYITDGSKNAKIPKDREPASLTLEECQALLAAAPEKTRGRRGAMGARKTGGAKAATARSAGERTSVKKATGEPTAAKKATAKKATAKTTATKTTSTRKTAAGAAAAKKVVSGKGDGTGTKRATARSTGPRSPSGKPRSTPTRASETQ
jgi:DNA topoisomerase-1